MTSPDPFAVLGVASTATLAELRAARRRLAQRLHPDHGGDEASMRELNAAYEQAIAALRVRAASPSAPAPDPTPPAPKSSPRPRPSRPHDGRPRRIRVVERDEASFVVQARPVEAFGALRAAAGRIGDLIDGEPGAWLEARVDEPSECWCRLDLLPEGDATMVALTLAHIEGTPWPPPGIDDARDAWIAALANLGGGDP
jgi:hypothetical protein